MAFPIEQVYEYEDIQGPGWLMFFTEVGRVIPAIAGGADGAAHREEIELTEDLNLDDEDIGDIMTIIALSGIL